MILLDDEQEIMRSYIESEVYEARQNEKLETAKRMLEDGALQIDKIAQYSGLPIEMVRRLSDDLQLV